MDGWTLLGGTSEPLEKESEVFSSTGHPVVSPCEQESLLSLFLCSLVSFFLLPGAFADESVHSAGESPPSHWGASSPSFSLIIAGHCPSRSCALPYLTGPSVTPDCTSDTSALPVGPD